MRDFAPTARLISCSGGGVSSSFDCDDTSMQEEGFIQGQWFADPLLNVTKYIPTRLCLILGSHETP